MITLKKNIEKEVELMADKIYGTTEQVVNILLAYLLGLKYPKSMVKDMEVEVVWRMEDNCEEAVNNLSKQLDKTEMKLLKCAYLYFESLYNFIQTSNNREAKKQFKESFWVEVTNKNIDNMIKYFLEHN